MSMFSASQNIIRVLAVRNSDEAPCGNFCKGLQHCGAQVTTIHGHKGEPIPADSDGFDGLVVLGGPQHAFDDADNPYFLPLMELMRRYEQDGKPVAGVCLGCQLLARAYGGRPFTLEKLEFGFVQHLRTPDGMTDPVVGGVQPPPLMEFHEDSFTLPPEARLLIEGAACANQCFRVGRVSYGFQFHLEVNYETIRHWIAKFKSGGIAAYSKYKSDYDERFFGVLDSGLDASMALSAKYCSHIAEKWLQLIDKKPSYRVLNT